MPYDEENQYFEMYDLDPCGPAHRGQEDFDDPLEDEFFDDIDGMFDHIDDDEPDFEDWN